MAQPPQAVQSDTLVQGKTTTAPSSSKDVSRGTFTHSFSKSFLVHISNNMGYPGFTLGHIDTPSDLDEGFHLVPYMIPYSSLNVHEWNSCIRDAEALRCVEMGFEMNEIQVSRIDTKQESGTTVLTSTIAPEGKLHTYIDHDHWTEIYMLNATTGQDIFEHSNQFQTPVCVDDPAQGVLPRVKMDFPGPMTNAIFQQVGAVPEYQGPSFYRDQGLEHHPGGQPFKHTWTGKSPWRVASLIHQSDGDYWEGGSTATTTSNNPIAPIVRRVNLAGNEYDESYIEGWYCSNLGTGVNVGRHDRPEFVYVKVEPAQDQSIGNITMNAKAWITYRSTWEFMRRQTRFWNFDLTNRMTPADVLGQLWSRQVMYPLFSMVDSQKLYLDNTQRYTRRVGPGGHTARVYGPPGQHAPHIQG